MITKPGGSKQRFGSGDWEQATNRQQRRLTRIFDAWSAQTRRALTGAASRGISIPDQMAILDRAMPELEAKLVEVLDVGTKAAARISAGSRAEMPEIQRVIGEHGREDRVLVAQALMPFIHARLAPEVARGLTGDPKALMGAFGAVRAAPGQYAGRAWVMIFETQQELGRTREAERHAKGLVAERVRWVLDPRAEHCVASPGHYGCPDLAHEYESWNDLPTVPAGMVTCRGNCLLEGNAVDTETIEAAFRMPYDGPALELVTQSGMRLSVTPGHPILTPQGWVMAQFLHKGDTVISGGFANGPQMVDENNENVPPFIEQIWRALSIMRGQADTTDFSPVTNDFHSDGRFMNGKVDVIWANGELWRKVNIPLSQINPKFSLISGFLGARSSFGSSTMRQFPHSSLATLHGGMVGGNLMPSLFKGHSAPLQSLGFALASDMDIMSNEKTTNRLTTEVERLSDEVLRFPTFISGDDINGDMEFAVGSPQQSQSIAVTAGLNTLGLEELPQTYAAYAGIMSQFVNGLAGQVSLDKLIEIRRFNYSGHVYDLQTERGFYFASSISHRQDERKLSGILAHNCRCHLEVYRDGEWRRGVFED